MAWLAFSAPVLAAIAIVAVLGLPAALALRLRGLALPLVAIPASFAVLAVASLAGPALGLSWSILLAGAVALALALVLLALHRWLGAPRAVAAARHGGLWLPLGAAAAGGLVIAIALAAALGSPQAVSQTFDANFHLNAVRYILDTGSASPLTVELTTPGAPVFYPTLWHGFVALVVQLSGASIPAATNAVLFTVSAVIWPVGAVALGRAVAGPSTHVTLISGALSAAFPTFPLFLAGYGVIYPNILSLALFPFLMVAVLQVLNLGPARRATPLSAGTRWLLLLGALGASVLAHPNALHTLLAWAALPVLFVVFRALRGGPVPSVSGALVASPIPLALRRTGAVVGAAALVAVIAGAWYFGRSTDNSWEGFYGPRSAALELIGGTPHLPGHAWPVALLVLIGVVLAWRHRSLRWVIGAAASLAFLYWVADGFPTTDWRTLLVGPWYNDPRRLAALVPFGALPLAVLGASALWAMLRPGLRRFARALSRRPRRFGRGLAALALLLLIAAGQSGADAAFQIVRSSYDPQQAALLDPDERKLLDRLADEVPAGEVIANNPLNGSSLSYAIADRAVLFPHGSGAYDPRAYTLVDSLVPAPGEACAVATELGVHYVLDFGTDYIFEDAGKRGIPFKRMRHLERSPILTEIDHQGDAVLYQITGC